MDFAGNKLTFSVSTCTQNCRQEKLWVTNSENKAHAYSRLNESSFISASDASFYGKERRCSARLIRLLSMTWLRHVQLRPQQRVSVWSSGITPTRQIHRHPLSTHTRKSLRDQGASGFWTKSKVVFPSNKLANWDRVCGGFKSRTRKCDAFRVQTRISGYYQW